MVYGFKRGNTPGFIPLVYMPYTFSKEGKCLHNRFAMLARAQTKLNPRPIEAGIQATPMARRFGLWLNQIAAALSTRRRRMKASSRERGADSFSREDAWCDVASHLRRSGVRFTAGPVDLPPMPLCFDRVQPKTLPSPPLCRRQHIHANRGRQCGADGLDSFIRLNMRDDAIGRDGLNTICGWPCRFKRRGARSAMSYAAKKVRSFFWRWRFMTRRSSSWRLGGVQEMAFAPASIVARMVSSFGPPLAMIGRFG